MGRFKPARGKKPITQQKANAIGCVIVIALAMLLMFLMVYYTVRQA